MTDEMYFLISFFFEVFVAVTGRIRTAGYLFLVPFTPRLS